MPSSDPVSLHESLPAHPTAIEPPAAPTGSSTQHTITPCLVPQISALNRRRQYICIRHPAYSAVNDLLVLEAVDTANGNRGIDYDLALAACGVVANNRWDGWFSTKDPSTGTFSRIERAENEILPCFDEDATIYYFFVGDDALEKYPVVPSFEHWRFPHTRLPQWWRSIALAGERAPGRSDVLDNFVRDEGCCITGCVEGIERAHIVPAEFAGWFNSNHMNRYCATRFSGPENIDDSANCTKMRRDLHFIFDQKRFVLVPKTSDKLPVVHLLDTGKTDELIKYHNLRMQPSRTRELPIREELLFARFAWAIFSDESYPLLSTADMSRHKFRVVVWDPKSGEQVEKNYSKEITAHVFLRPSSTRSISPSKRKLGEMGDGEAPRGRTMHRACEGFRSTNGDGDEDDEEELSQLAESMCSHSTIDEKPPQTPVEEMQGLQHEDLDSVKPMYIESEDKGRDLKRRRLSADSNT